MRFFSLSLGAIACIALGQQAFGQAGNNNPGGVTSDFHGSITTAGYYDPYTGNAKREITDIVVPGSIGAYPLQYTRTLNTRGPGGWSNNYVWEVTMYHPYFDPGTCGPDIEYCESVGHVTYPSGGGSFELFDPYPESLWRLDANGRNGPEDLLFDCAKAQSQCTPGARFELWRADGGKVLFQVTQPNAHTFRAYAIIDPYGQQTTLSYNGSGQLWKVTEPGGRYLQLNYQDYTYLEVDGKWYTKSLLGSVQAYAAFSLLIETVRYSVPSLTKVYYDDGAEATYTYEQTYTTCNDSRYAGPMKFIKYDYVQANEGGQFFVMGQVKAERNAGQVVSQITFPTSYTDPNLLIRTETRGDGFSRRFNYGGGQLTWTDFKNKTWTETQDLTSNSWTITDPRGNATKSEREDTIGALRKITYPATPDNGVTTREYAFSGPNVPYNPYFHYGEKDENGNWTYFDRDANHRVKKITYPDQSTEEFTYNNFGQVLAHRPKSVTSTVTNTNLWENCQYDGRGLKTLSYPPATASDPDPWNHPTRYYYYTSGPNTDRLQRVQDPRNNSTAYEYNQRGQVTKVIHPDTSYTQSAYNLDGTVAWTADENHPGAATDPYQRTRYTYDQYKRVLTVTNPLGETATNYYGLDWANPLLHTTNTLKYTLSPLNKNVVYDYDENLRKIAQTVAANTSDIATTWFEYDSVGNCQKVTDPRGKITTFGYDQRNRQTSVTNALNQTSYSGYNAVGEKRSETRPDGAFRTWEYNDPLNRLTKTIDWRMSTAEPVVATTYTYGPPNAQNVTTEHIIDPKNADYIFEFDALHRKTSATYPPDATSGGRSERFWYDAVGNLRLYKNPAGQYKHLDYADSYDSRNRLRRVGWNSSPTDNLNVVWEIGPETRTQYDDASRMTEIKTNNGQTLVTFYYDDANRKLWEDQTVAGSAPHRVQHDYDSDGNAINTHVPGWVLNWHHYTERNQMDRITDGSGNPWINFTYDSAGNLTKRQNVYGGANDSLNVPSQYYDGLNRPTRLENTAAGDTMFARSWQQFDTAGRMTATWRDEEGSKGERFTFNTSNHLTNAVYKANNVWTQTPSNALTTQQYAYTPDMLNRASLTENGAVTNYAQSGQLNQYANVGGVQVGYDGNLNLSSFGAATATYNAQNQLIAVNNGNGTTQFVYDGLGRCLKRTVNGAAIVFAFDGWKPIAEWAGDGSYWGFRIYGPGGDEVLWQYDSRYGHYRVHSDMHGNVIALLDWSGNVVEKYSYNAFGQPTITDPAGVSRDESVCKNRFLFQGREWIREVGLYDYRHRFYFPLIGRFLQADPTGFDAGDMNLFRYCDDDPVDQSDPTGLVPPGKDLMDVSRATLRELWKEHIKNVHEALKPGNWRQLPGGKLVKPEFGTIVESKSGKPQSPTGPLKGDKQGPNQQPIVEFKRHKGKEWKVERISHVHTTWWGTHYDQDVPTADRLHTISGVGSTFDKGKYLELYVPREKGGGRGGLFRTGDGEHLTDLDNHPVPH